MRPFRIDPLDRSLEGAVREKIDNLNKPRGSLGVLEDLATRVCLIQHTLSPTLRHPVHLLFGGDHGIEREGVSVSPREVTWQQMINFTRGGAAVNMFCRQHSFALNIVDMGVDHDLSDCPAIINRKIAFGTADFLYSPAMSGEQFEHAVAAGAEMVDGARREGCDIIGVGEMGIANTSASSVWMHLLSGKNDSDMIALDDCVGRGSGADDAMLLHKREVLSLSVDRWKDRLSVCQRRRPPLTGDMGILPYFGGFEMAAAIGAMLQAAERHIVILVDGFIMTACLLAAWRLYPAVLDYAVFAHLGSESGHRRMISLMSGEAPLKRRPLLELGLRLGEGTGALCAFPLVDSAVRMMNEMSTFSDADITKYF